MTTNLSYSATKRKCESLGLSRCEGSKNTLLAAIEASETEESPSKASPRRSPLNTSPIKRESTSSIRSSRKATPVKQQKTVMEPLTLPFRLERYVTVSTDKLGEGSFGSVYRFAFPGESVKNYAIKVMPYENGISESTLFEVATLRRFRHPNIVPIVDVVMDVVRPSGTRAGLGMVMELAKSDLKRRLDDRSLTLVEKRRIAYQVCSGMAFLHHHDIIHRDLKPQNVLLFEDLSTPGVLTAKITDMGLSAPFGCVVHEMFTMHAYTLWYRPPEILMGGKYYLAADVWSLGCLLYELYTGTPLFPGDSEIDQLYQIFRVLGTPTNKEWSDVEDLPDYNQSFPKWQPHSLTWIVLPREIASLIQRALIYDPLKRPSAYELLTDPFFDPIRDSTIEFAPRPCELNLDDSDVIVDDVLRNQPDIVENDLLILQDWLIAVSIVFKLRNRSALLGLKLLDLYLQRETDQIDKANFQLIGASIMHIAATLCEEIPPELNDWVRYGAGAYTSDEMTNKIEHVVKIMQFDFIVSIPYDYRLDEAERSIYRVGDDYKIDGIRKALYYLVAMSPIRYGKSARTINDLVVTMTQFYANQTTGITQREIEIIKQLINELQNDTIAESMKMTFRKHAYTDIESVLAKFKQRVGNV